MNDHKITKVVVAWTTNNYGNDISEYPLSKEAVEILGDKCVLEKFETISAYYLPKDIARDDPDLVVAVEKLGNGIIASKTAHVHVKVISIPADVQWEVKRKYSFGDSQYMEYVEEVHRSWWP